MKVLYLKLFLNIWCKAIALKALFFCTFRRLNTLALWQKVVLNLLIFEYLFCQKYSTIGSRKTSITMERLVVERCLTPGWITFLILYWLVCSIRSYFNKLILAWNVYWYITWALPWAYTFRDEVKYKNDLPVFISATLIRVDVLAFPNIFLALKIFGAFLITSCECER